MLDTEESDVSINFGENGGQTVGVVMLPRRLMRAKPEFDHIKSRHNLVHFEVFFQVASPPHRCLIDHCQQIERRK